MHLAENFWKIWNRGLKIRPIFDRNTMHTCLPLKLFFFCTLSPDTKNCKSGPKTFGGQPAWRVIRTSAVYAYRRLSFCLLLFPKVLTHWLVVMAFFHSSIQSRSAQCELNDERCRIGPAKYTKFASYKFRYENQARI